jgi:hypothetical protein
MVFCMIRQTDEVRKERICVRWKNDGVGKRGTSARDREEDNAHLETAGNIASHSSFLAALCSSHLLSLLAHRPYSVQRIARILIGCC